MGTRGFLGKLEFLYLREFAEMVGLDLERQCLDQGQCLDQSSAWARARQLGIKGMGEEEFILDGGF